VTLVPFLEEISGCSRNHSTLTNSRSPIEHFVADQNPYRNSLVLGRFPILPGSFRCCSQAAPPVEKTWAEYSRKHRPTSFHQSSTASSSRFDDISIHPLLLRITGGFSVPVVNTIKIQLWNFSRKSAGPSTLSRATVSQPPSV